MTPFGIAVLFRRTNQSKFSSGRVPRKKKTFSGDVAGNASTLQRPAAAAAAIHFSRVTPDDNYIPGIAGARSALFIQEADKKNASS